MEYQVHIKLRHTKRAGEAHGSKAPRSTLTTIAITMIAITVGHAVGINPTDLIHTMA